MTRRETTPSVPTSIDLSHLRHILRHTPDDQNVMLVGRHGIGKSEILRSYHEDQGRTVVALFLGQMSDPGDLIGIPRIDPRTQRTEFQPPSWWPRDGEPIVLILDELNRARPEMLQSVMELTLSKSLLGRRLPAGSIVAAAVNDGDEYQLTEMDPALVSRFNVYQFEPTLREWLDYATARGVDERLIDFIRLHPHWLDGDETTATSAGVGLELKRTPDRRAWLRVDQVLRSSGGVPMDDQWAVLVAGIVGGPAADAFAIHCRSALPVSADEVFHRGIDPDQLRELSVEQTTRLNERLHREILRDPGRPVDAVRRYLRLLEQIGRRECVANLVVALAKDDRTMNWMSPDVDLVKLASEYLAGDGGES